MTKTAADEFYAWVKRYRDRPDLFVREVLSIEPDPWQVDLMMAVAGGHRRCSVRSGHGVGKALDVDDVVPTPAGMRRWGDLRPGDEVFGADGRPVPVVACRHFPRAPFYRVTFDDGSWTDVSSGHLWSVRGRAERRRGDSGWRVLETIELLELGVKRRNGGALARQWEVPVQGAARFPRREVPLDAYFFGVWLGDGTAGRPAWTKPEPAIAEAVSAAGYDVRTSESGLSHYVRGVAAHFRDGVLACGSHERFIPEDYLLNDVESRRALLAGLCDTDGEVIHTGSVTYSTTSRRLADDVVFLARSLGCKAWVQAAVKRGRYRRPDGDVVECRDCWRVTINAPFNPFRASADKWAAWRLSDRRYRVRWIESIEPISERDGMCIQVGAADGLYQARDFVVTHNSSCVSWIALWFLLTRYPVKVVITAPTSSQLFDALFAEIKRWINELPTSLKRILNVKSDKIELLEAKAEAFISARTSRAETPEALQGVHSDHTLLIADEASGVPEAVFEAAAGSMSGEHACTILLGNPTRSSGFFYDTHNRLRDDWWTRRVSCEDSPRVSKAYIQEMASRYGAESNAFRVRVLGEFPLADDDTVIPIHLIEAAIHRDVTERPDVSPVWGLDVARFGSDKSALAKRYGHVITEVQAWAGLDLMQLCGRVKAEFDALQVRERPTEILVDSIGLGAGVVDRLRELGLPARGVNVAESPSLGATYVNLRAELWFRVKAWLEQRNSKLPNDEGLLAELASPRYTFTSNGKMKVEAKDEMRKRGLASPDKADAVCLTFAGEAASAIYGSAGASSWSRPIRRNLKGVA